MSFSARAARDQRHVALVQRAHRRHEPDMPPAAPRSSASRSSPIVRRSSSHGQRSVASASARYSGPSCGRRRSDLATMRLTVSRSPRTNGPGGREAVLHRPPHEGLERLRRRPRRVHEVRCRTVQGDEERGGHRRGRVVGRTLLVGQLERLEPEQRGQRVPASSARGLGRERAAGAVELLRPEAALKGLQAGGGRSGGGAARAS